MSEALVLIGSALMAAGTFFVVVGAIGLVRFPGIYLRIHAVSITDSLGAALVIVGLGFVAAAEGYVLEMLKLALVVGFFGLTNPLAGHALAKATWLHGVRPWTSEEADQEVLGDR